MAYGATPEDWAHFSGYLSLTADLLPVVSNPNAKISPKSVLKNLGQIPSRYNKSGLASGFADWTKHQTTLQEISEWSKNDDYGICIQTRSIRALDCDLPDNDIAEKVHTWLLNRFPASGFPLRGRGNSSKFLVPFYLPGEFGKRVIKIDAKNKIEFLANGQQFVAFGTHPSGVKYEWRGGLPEKPPVLSTEAFETLWQDLAKTFDAEPSTNDYAQRKPAGELASDDFVLNWLEQKELVLGYSNEGSAYVSCPFKAGHSVEKDMTETIYFPAGLRGYERGHFHCLHASCAERSDESFLDALGYRVEMFEDLGPLPAAETAASGDLKYRFITALEYANRPPPEYIVQDILPRGELAMIFGESGSGKSFIAIDLAMSISRAVEWNGYTSKAGRVAYICAEGAGAMRNRLRAYAEHHKISLNAIPLVLLPDAPNLLENGDAAEVAKGLLAHGKIDLLFIDTLAQTTPGDEDADAFKKAIANCKKIYKATGAMCVLIHHPGKDLSKGPRGSSVLYGAADCIIEVSRNENNRFLKILKQKDGEEGQEWGLNLIQVNIDMDAEGRVMSSCAVEYVAGARRKVKQKQRGENETAVLKAFDELGGVSCDVGDLISKSLNYMLKDPEKRDQRRAYSRRAIFSLAKQGEWTISGDRVERLL